MQEKMDMDEASEKDQKVVENELQKSVDSETKSAKSQGKILAEQLTEASETYRRSSAGTFYSSVIAGLEIGFSYLLLCTVFSFCSPRYSEDVVF